MKKLFFILALSAITWCAGAQTIVKIGEAITSSDTVQVEVQLNTVRPFSSTQTIYIQVDAGNSGTIQFSVDEVINDDYYAWPAGSRIPITIRNGRDNLRYKASASDQTFVITQ